MYRHLISLGLLAALVVSGCGNDSDDSPDEAITVTTPTTAIEDTLADEGDESAEVDDPEADDEAVADEMIVTVSGSEELRVSDQDNAVHCDGGGELEIVADDLSVTITGSCEDLDIDANGVDIEAEDVEDIDIDGDDNMVTADNVEDLDIDGDANTVNLTSVNEVDVDGDDNTVTYEEGSPEVDVDDDGSGNDVSSA